MALMWTALVPAIMAVGYLLLIVYFRMRGGYQQVHIGEDQSGEVSPDQGTLPSHSRPPPPEVSPPPETE
jgi:hypothetical protein